MRFLRGVRDLGWEERTERMGGNTLRGNAERNLGKNVEANPKGPKDSGIHE